MSEPFMHQLVRHLGSCPDSRRLNRPDETYIRCDFQGSRLTRTNPQNPAFGAREETVFIVPLVVENRAQAPTG
jgi:hypothetical protein